jgi:hypothetical protein
MRFKKHLKRVTRNAKKNLRHNNFRFAETESEHEDKEKFATAFNLAASEERSRYGEDLAETLLREE